eukprot:gene10479-10638_t
MAQYMSTTGLLCLLLALATVEASGTVKLARREAVRGKDSSKIAFGGKILPEPKTTVVINPRVDSAADGNSTTEATVQNPTRSVDVQVKPSSFGYPGGAGFDGVYKSSSSTTIPIG